MVLILKCRLHAPSPPVISELYVQRAIRCCCRRTSNCLYDLVVQLNICKFDWQCHSNPIDPLFASPQLMNLTSLCISSISTPFPETRTFYWT
jgi:hypothetical protein